MAKSTFYRNSKISRCTKLRADLVMEKLPLQIFDGDVREYHEFRDLFVSLIDPQGHLRPFQKLRHLLRHLEGTPRLRAEGYTVCDEAYYDVLEMLERGYGDNVVIQGTLLADFYNMRPPTEQTADLTTFLEEAETVTKRLKRSDIDVDDSHTYC